MLQFVTIMMVTATLANVSTSSTVSLNTTDELLNETQTTERDDSFTNTSGSVTSSAETSTSTNIINSSAVRNSSENITESPSEVEAVSRKAAIDKVYLVFVPTCFFIGLAGNGITLFTMLSLPFRTMKWSICLTTLAVTDSTALFIIAVNKQFVVDLFGMDILAISNSGCQVYHFFRRSIKMVSSWLMVIICIERFIAICLPLKARIMCTKRKTVSFIIVICSVAVVFSGLSIKNVGVRGSACLPTIATSQTRLEATVMVLLGSLLNAILPMFILIVLTLIICITLVRQRKARSRITVRSDQADSYTKVSAMLVSVHTSYIILILPLLIDINLRFVRQFDEEVYEGEVMDVFGTFARVLEMINHSVNFFLYAGFNSLFRNRLKDIIFRRNR